MGLVTRKKLFSIMALCAMVGLLLLLWSSRFRRWPSARTRPMR